MATNPAIIIRLTSKDDNFTSTISKAVKGLKAMQETTKIYNRDARELTGTLTGMSGKFAALFGGVSATAFAKSIFDTGVSMDRLDKAFTAITGSSAAAKEELEFVREAADKLGLKFDSTAEAYKGLAAATKGTNLEGKVTRDVFLGVSKAAAALGMSADDTQGSLRAISQMVSKGKVTMEELSQQLGERLPGSFQLAAKAMGVTTQELSKLLQLGKVSPQEFLPKFAEQLEKQFGKGAEEAGNSATATVNRFANAWTFLKKTIADSGFMDTATGKIKDLTAVMQDPKVQQRVVELTESLTTMAESALNFAVNYGEAIVKVGAGLVVLSAVSRTVALLTGIWKGLNVAMVFMTGLPLIPYLARLRTSLDLAKISALGVTGALGAAAGGALAYLSGVNIGEQIYKATEIAEKELANLRQEIDVTAAKFRQFAGFKPETQESLFAKSERDLESYRKAMEGAFRYQAAVVQSLYATSREVDFWGNQTDGAKQAEVELTAAKIKLQEIEKAMNEYGSVAEKVHKRTAEAAKNSALNEKDAKITSLEDIKREYQKYADIVKRLQDEIAGKERSLAAELRAMSRSGMTDLGAWQDRKKEYNELIAAVQQAKEEMKTALAAGDQAGAEKAFNLARENAEAAKEAARDLNNEILNGNQVAISKQEALKIAQDGVKKAGEENLEVMRLFEKAAGTTADNLNKLSGWTFGDAFTEAGKEAKGLIDQAEKFGENWEASFIRMGVQAAKEIDEIRRNLDDMAKNRDVYFRIHYVDDGEPTKRSQGGPVYRYARGGKLPGYGGGDKVKALLEPGEFVVRKEAVARYGLKYLEMLNAMRLNDFSIIRANIGGLISSANKSIGMAPMRFNQGGMVPADPSKTNRSETINVNLNLPTQGKPIPMKIDKQFVREFMRQLELVHRGRSS